MEEYCPNALHGAINRSYNNVIFLTKTKTKMAKNEKTTNSLTKTKTTTKNDEN